MSKETDRKAKRDTRANPAGRACPGREYFSIRRIGWKGGFHKNSAVSVLKFVEIRGMIRTETILTAFRFHIFIRRGLSPVIYTVTFNPAIDYVVRLDTLKPGAINRNQAEDFQFGGKGINVSNVLRTLGYDTVALGFTAGFIGEGLEKGLRDMGLQTDFIRVAEGMTRINMKVKADLETEINGIGPVITAGDMDRLYEKLDRVTPEDVLVLSGSIPKCLPADTYEKIMARLDGKGIRIAVDAERDLLVNVLKYHPFLIKPNNHELGEIFGRVLKTDEEIIECAAKLQERGGRNVLVSMAGDGALLLDEQGQSHRIGCPSGKVVNSVGAGDSMVAGFLAGYLKDGDYGYALKLGTAAGSATAFSIGLASREKIDELMAGL